MRVSYRLAQVIVQIGGVLWCGVRVFGRRNIPRAGPVVLACNHQCFLDPLLVGLALDRECNFMARDTLFTGTIGGRVIEWLNAYPVRRGTADFGAIKETLRRLKAGQVVVAFPEGTRSPDGRIGDLEVGVAAIAKKSGAALVPTVVEGAFECWPRQKAFPRPGQVWVEYGRAFTPADYADCSHDELTVRLQERLQKMHNVLRVRYNRKPFDYSAAGGGGGVRHSGPDEKPA